MSTEKKSLYGSKQSPRQWYKRFDHYVTGAGFKRSDYDVCLYYKDIDTNKAVYLLLYVDNMLITIKDLRTIDEVKRMLSIEFDMKDLGCAKRILGINIKRDKRNKVLCLSQEVYLRKVVKRFSMDQAKEVKVPLAGHFKLSAEQSPTTEEEKLKMAKVPYSSAVGSLMFSMICTRPDLAFVVNVLSKNMSNPREEHWLALKWVLRYVNSTINYGLIYKHSKGPLTLDGFVDSDYVGDSDRKRSTSAYMMTLGGNYIRWKSQL